MFGELLHGISGPAQEMFPEERMWARGANLSDFLTVKCGGRTLNEPHHLCPWGHVYERVGYMAKGTFVTQLRLLISQPYQDKEVILHD